MTWAVWRDPSGSVGVTRYRDVTEAAATCKTHGCVLLNVADDQTAARRIAYSLQARFTDTQGRAS